MKTVNVLDALAKIGGNRAIIASPGCGAPTTLLQAIGDNADLVRGSKLYSGLLLGDYPFLPAVEQGIISYGTWHVMPPLRRLVERGVVSFYPVRASGVIPLIKHLSVDTALIRVSPPDNHGFCNLGPSVSYPIHAVRMKTMVIAEIDESMPRLYGDANVHVSEIDFFVDSTTPMPEYRRATPDESSKAIAKRILDLLPPSPTLQIGIGAIPEALLDAIGAAGVPNLRFAGMAVDGMADLFDAGLIARGPYHPYPPIVAAELMGTRRLMEFADRNAAIGNFGSPVGIGVVPLSSMENFVSINSAIEIDKLGQINSEWAAGRQLSGIGGSIDFFEAAAHSQGGRRIIAMNAINLRDSSSKIVATLAPDTPVTIPRHSVDYVVTEYGVAPLGMATVKERSEMLAAIAHPDHRDDIMRS